MKKLLLAALAALIIFSSSCVSPWYVGGKKWQDKAGNIHLVPMSKRKSLFH